MLNRRQILIGSTALPIAGLPAVSGLGAQGSHPAAVEGRATTDAEGTATSDLARFANTLKYEDLPAEVIDAAKRCVIDAVGCTLGGWQTSKGQRSAEVMARLGGPAEARLFGHEARLSVANAAFANAELMNGLDFDAIPHIPPVILPALMAVAEARNVSGKDFILAVVIAYELAARLSSASSAMQQALLETGTTPEVFGINQEALMACAAALARMLGLSVEATEHAIGLAGYYCPPQSSHDWETGSPKTNVKYTPVGWVNQGAVTAALLAEAGYTGNPRVLDGPAGFARFYGWSRWDIPAVTRGLGEQWRILTADYKPYACCRYVHSRLDALIDVIESNKIKPDAIESIMSWGPPFVANPDQMNVRTQEDAQFSVPYMLAIAAMGLPVDAQCQSPALLADERVKAMMGRIKWATHPRTTETKRADPRSFIASAEITVSGGKVYSGEVMFARGNGSVPQARMSDADLDRKFLGNAGLRLTGSRAQSVLAMMRSLETVSRLSDLTSQLSV